MMQRCVRILVLRRLPEEEMVAVVEMIRVVVLLVQGRGLVRPLDVMGILLTRINAHTLFA